MLLFVMENFFKKKKRKRYLLFADISLSRFRERDIISFSRAKYFLVFARYYFLLPNIISFSPDIISFLQILSRFHERDNISFAQNIISF